jgi:hypothetical protein
MRGRTSVLTIEIDTQTRKTLLSWLKRQKLTAQCCVHNLFFCLEKRLHLQFFNFHSI